MKTYTYFLQKLGLLLLMASPVAVLAAPPATSPYVTDKTNSYVQDQTSQAMSNLNDILCHVSAMDPADMVNLGAYIALIDRSICSPNDSGGNSGSTGANYVPAIVNSTRADASSPMIAKVWLDDVGGGNGSKQSITAYLSATQAPNLPSDPYGRFRLDFCGKDPVSGLCTGKGYINSTASGLAFYSRDESDWGSGPVVQTLQMQLSANSTSGSGQLSMTYAGNTNGNATDSAFRFAYDANYFMRSDSTGAGQVCFSRNPNDAADSVWSYGLYDSTTGARIERNSGFPIEYTDATSGNKMNGYVGYWGMNSPTPIANGATVNKVTYGGGGSPTKTPYTLLQAGGKLTKFTKVTKTLDALDKVKFQFWLQVASLPLNNGGSGVTLTQSMGCSSYEVYWDKTAANFKITGQQDSTNNCNVKSLATPYTMTIQEMQSAAPWGFYGWSQMTGGDFNISSTEMANLSGSSVVVLHTQDVIYPSDFAAFTNGLVCIENCPTAADIALSNAQGAQPNVLPYATGYTDWNFGTGGRAPYQYTLDAATGNLMDAAATPAPVVSTASQSSGTTGNYGYNNNGIQSGRLAVQADLEVQVAARTGTSGFYLPQDYDQLTTYYQWQTGGNSWNQLAVLYSGSTPVVFDPPLNVDFVVPSTGAKYGPYLGATFTLQYGGFGNLWGIPSTCIDISTNLPCAANGGTANNLQRWTPHFSIQDGSTVTVSGSNTTYLVKALQKEVRLGKVDCAVTTLTLPAAATLNLSASWSDPSNAASSNYVGTRPDFGSTPPAPQVIHGVKMY